MALAAAALFMALFAHPAIALGAPPAPQLAAGGAAIASPGGTAWPADLTSRLAAALASSWGVEESRLHVSWYPAPGVQPPADGTPLRIAGRGQGGWIVAVFDPANASPLAVRARVAMDDSVCVAAHELMAGHALTSDDLKHESRMRWGGPEVGAPATGLLRAPGASVPAPGWVTRRAIAAGEVVSWPAAMPPAVIRDGQSVEVHWERGGVRVSTRATALEPASEGARVRVRLADGSICRDAVVVGSGVVAIQAGERP